MQVGNFVIWCSSWRASELGATHHARLHGLIPGFYGETDGLWISRSDIFNPLEDALSWLWAAMRSMRGEEPDFMFVIGKPLHHP